MTLHESLETLGRVVRTAENRLDPQVVSSAESFLAGAAARRAEDMEVTVVAFAGATGSGKSSLLNAVLGREVARSAATRPTTARALAVGQDHASLYQALGIPEKIVYTSEESAIFGDVVLVDLPDIDSTEEAHHREAERIIGRADVLVWVLDPQKYADAVLHAQYLRKMSQHSEVMLVVLNQIDRVNPGEWESLRTDVSGRLRADGIDNQVLLTSAVTGEGVQALREAVVGIGRTRQAAVLRLAADIRTHAAALAGSLGKDGGSGEAPDTHDDEGWDTVSVSVATALGADIVAHAAAQSYLYRAASSTAWPPARLIKRPDPLGRLHVGERVSASNIVARPGDVAVARAEIERRVDASLRGLPRLWKREMKNQATQRSESVFARSSAFSVSPVEHRHWWTWWNILQWLVCALSVAGVGWLGALWVADALRIALAEPPMVGPIAIPTLMVGVGVLLTLLLVALGRRMRSVGAVREEARVLRQLRRDVDGQVRSAIKDPLDRDLAEYREFLQMLRALSVAE